MSPEDAETTLARADFARFLSACYYQPGPEFAEERMFDSMRAIASRIDPGLEQSGRQLGNAFAAEKPETLLLDYMRLFLGPNAVVARPYGSVWLEDKRTLMGDTTVAVQTLYRAGGFDLDESFRELPDHVAVELEFLYLLLFREGQARETGDDAALAETLALRRQFLSTHLGRWVGPFTSAMGVGAQTDFYRELARATNQFVRMETVRMSD